MSSASPGELHPSSDAGAVEPPWPLRSTKTAHTQTALPNGRVSAMLCAKPGTKTVTGSPRRGTDVVQVVLVSTELRQRPSTGRAGRRTAAAADAREHCGSDRRRIHQRGDDRRKPRNAADAEEEQRQCGDSGDRRGHAVRRALPGSQTPSRSDQRVDERETPRANRQARASPKTVSRPVSTHASSVRRGAEGPGATRSWGRAGRGRVEGNERGGSSQRRAGKPAERPGLGSAVGSGGVVGLRRRWLAGARGVGVGLGGGGWATNARPRPRPLRRPSCARTSRRRPRGGSRKRGVLVGGLGSPRGWSR